MSLPEEDGPPTYAGYGAAEIALSTRVGDHATTGQDTTEREIPLAQINTSTVNGSKLRALKSEQVQTAT